jgi:hypothetical protein
MWPFNLAITILAGDLIRHWLPSIGGLVIGGESKISGFNQMLPRPSLIGCSYGAKAPMRCMA